MCTAVNYTPDDHYFGRNLDLEFSYHETVTITPRRFPFHFRKAASLLSHYAIIGMAYVVDDYPLYYDATNEAGLSMAGLNFPEYAVYQNEMPDLDNITPFELIPWVLGRCADLEQARQCLLRLNLIDLNFSSELTNTPLHWIVSDTSGSITVEPLAAGLHIYDNPTGILANSPSFDWQMTNLRNYLSLTRETPENRFSDTLELSPYSRGMGALGLPGDWSSSSRFIRAAFLTQNARSGPNEASHVHQFFHILSGVEQPRGCIHLGKDQFELTVYSSCCNTRKGIYYYTTYENRQITAVDLHKVPLDCETLFCYPLLRMTQFHMQN